MYYRKIQKRLLMKVAGKGNIETYEMYRTFNCGVGMVIALPQSQVETALAILKQSGENAWLIGHIESATDNEPQVIIK